MSEVEPSESSPPPFVKHSGKTKYLWIIGVAGYLGFLAYIGWEDIKNALFDIEYRYLFAVIVLDIAVLWFRVGKWHIALKGESEITKLAFLSKAGGNLTPGRLGEFSPLLLQQFRSAKTGAWILFDRLLEAAATLILGLIGIVAVIGIIEGNILLYASIALLLAITILSYILMQERTIQKLQYRFNAISILQRPLQLLASLSIELARLRPKTPIFLLMTLFATAIDIMIAYFLCRALGFDLPLTFLALVQVVHAVTSIIPITPNATGVPYAAAATILHQVGGMALEAVALVIALRMVLGNAVFWSSFLIGIRSKNSLPKENT